MQSKHVTGLVPSGVWKNDSPTDHHIWQSNSKKRAFPRPFRYGRGDESGRLFQPNHAQPDATTTLSIFVGLGW